LSHEDILTVKRQKTIKTNAFSYLLYTLCRDLMRMILMGASYSVSRAFSQQTSASSSSNIQLQDRDLIYWKAWEAKAKAKSV